VGDTNTTSDISGALTVGYGYCFAAIAANEQLDVAGAEAHLRQRDANRAAAVRTPNLCRKARRILLGELLYERGQLDEAEALLDDAYQLGTEGGLVDFMLATFGTGARLKLTLGDTASARDRLAEGLDIARTLQLPRLEARLLNETVRLAAMSAEPIDGVGSTANSRTQALKRSTESATSQPNSLRIRKSDCS